MVLAVAGIAAAVSCGDEQQELEGWFTGLQTETLQLSPDVSLTVTTTPSSVEHRYEGNLCLESYGMTETVPVVLYMDGSEKKYEFKLNSASVEQKLRTFMERSYLAGKVSHCESWNALGSILTGAWLSEWSALEERRAALFEEYRNYYPEQYSREAMEKYNAFIDKNVNNFLGKIGGQKLFLKGITEEERQQAIEYERSRNNDFAL